eukprot:c19284_g1_i3.p3 GENE.c19284_g1_i3~~c19284_g1_i3.p3  ORF type:complete len:100 (-),score=6.40 c19284_g1_i3:770-1069(-)
MALLSVVGSTQQLAAYELAGHVAGLSFVRPRVVFHFPKSRSGSVAHALELALSLLVHLRLAMASFFECDDRRFFPGIRCSLFELLGQSGTVFGGCRCRV